MMFEREMERVLLVGGSVNERLKVQSHLEALGLEVTTSPDISLSVKLFEQNDYDLTVLFHQRELFDALEFLEAIKELSKPSRVVVLSKEASMEDAQRIMELGALDFRLPPWTGEVLGFVVKRALASRPPGKEKTEEKNQSENGLNKKCSLSHNFDRYKILTKSPLMEDILSKAKSVAKSKATVLIQGESGTGKELLARYIHQHSDRASGPFVAINCAALPETLLESELFGHEKGAFSGAIMKKLGKFELANGGTILLDEITEMALPLQAKLLRVLQENEIDRVGGHSPIPIDVRVIATTNRDVLAAVRAGKFREDLYFRLNVIPLKVPPLRARKEDIGYLAEYFREHFVKEYGKNGLKFAKDCLKKLSERKWNGNIRELKNIVERGVLLARGKEITLQDLLGDELELDENNSAHDKGASLGKDIFDLGEVEKEMIKRALSKTKGNRTHAAKLLGISVRTLRNKLAEYRTMGLVL